MNPLLRTQLERIDAALDTLSAALEASKNEMGQLAKEKERLLQETWRHRKEAAALQRAGDDYDALMQENVAWRQAAASLQEGLYTLLTQTRALANELRQ